MPKKPILVTGAAGFIGFHLANRLLQDGHNVVGLDNLSNYYDVDLKRARLAQLEGRPHFVFQQLDISHRNETAEFFQKYPFEMVLHMAAQAGVRYSLENPAAYTESNLVGFSNILEGCRRSDIHHLIFASSSSVYGANANVPYSVHHPVDHPISFYAATKRANELMAHSYAHLYSLPCSGIRLFTVYGPWGRPDMAPILFARAILQGTPIQIFNEGNLQRDFTYIDDVVEGVVRIMHRIPKGNLSWSAQMPDPSCSRAPFRIYNLGNNHPVPILRFIEILEELLGKKAVKHFLSDQLSEVPITFADIDDLIHEVGYQPVVSIAEGARRFVEWFTGYYASSAGYEGGLVPTILSQSKEAR